MSAPNERNIKADESSAFFANNDASSYNTRYLKSIRNKDRFQELHFYQCSIELIDDLFPKQPQKGTLGPPAPYRASAVTLSQWRELEQEEQLSVLEKEEQGPGGEAKQDNDSGGALKRTENPGDVEQVPVSKLLKTENQGAIPDRWDPSLDDLNVDFCKGRSCGGINLDFLKVNHPSEEGKLPGFGALVGDAMQFKAQAYKTGQSWPFASDPSVIGAIVDQLSVENDKSITVLKWVFVQPVATSSEEAATNSNKLNSVQLHCVSCERDSLTTPCRSCKANVADILNMCGSRLAS